MSEHWATHQIKSLNVEKARFEQHALENIWTHAFSNPETGWELSDVVKKAFFQEGFNLRPTTAKIAEGKSFTDELREFKRLLFKGACEYLHTQNRTDGRVTQNRIFQVLKSSVRYGRFIDIDAVRRWARSPEFKDIVEDYAVITGHARIDKTTDLYEQAIREWWRKNPKAKKVSFVEVAGMLNLVSAAVYSKVNRTPSLKRLMRERPMDLWG